MTIFPNLPERVAQLSAPATALTLTTPEPVAKDRRTVLRAVYAHYSANVTLNAVVTLVSALGTAYNIVLSTLVLTGEQDGVYLPEVSIPLSEGDTISVLAPSGGGVITSGVQILLDYEWSVPEYGPPTRDPFGHPTRPV